MSKVHKSRHRVPVLQMTSDPISERYQTEIDMSTRRLERRYRGAQKALEGAEKRLARIADSQDVKTQRRYRDLLAVIEDRRRELREIERLMMPLLYTNRDSRRRLVRHEVGAITVPLGATTGVRSKCQRQPVYPTVESRVEALLTTEASA